MSLHASRIGVRVDTGNGRKQLIPAGCPGVGRLLRGHLNGFREVWHVGSACERTLAGR